MDITLIALALVLLLAIVFLSLYLFKSITKKSFTADDGSIFDNQADMEKYQKLYDKTKLLFVVEDPQSTKQPILGFEKLFLKKLTNESFPDLKTLFKYRKQFKLLSDLINS